MRLGTCCRGGGLAAATLFDGGSRSTCSSLFTIASFLPPWLWKVQGGGGGRGREEEEEEREKEEEEEEGLTPVSKFTCVRVTDLLSR